MKTLLSLISIFLTGFLVLIMAAGAVAEQDLKSIVGTSSISTLSVAKNVVFTLGPGEELTFTWADGKFRITYPPDKMEEAGKVFLNWLESYMLAGFDITPKKK